MLGARGAQQVDALVVEEDRRAPVDVELEVEPGVTLFVVCDVPATVSFLLALAENGVVVSTPDHAAMTPTTFSEAPNVTA